MASGKRASMREGPLAALFRATDEEGAEAPEQKKETAREPVERERPATERSELRAPEPAPVGVGALDPRGP